MKQDYTIEELKEKVDIVDVVSSYIDLKKQGSEYVACCPFHDEKTPSFTVSPNKQMAYCFGCGWGDSAFGFIKEYENLTDSETVEVMKQKAGIVEGKDRDINNPVKRESVKPNDPSDDWQVIMPVPGGAPKLMDGGRTIPVYNPKTDKSTVYKPEQGGVYPYRSTSGELLGAVLRVIIKDKKLTPTITYCVNSKTGEERWTLKGFPEPRPIYNQDELSDKPVLLVEGEKCADAANMHVENEYTAVSWPMGTNSVDKVDWSPLYSRDVVMWADNDVKDYLRGAKEGEIKPQDEQNGRKAMIWIKKHLEANGSEVTLLDQPENKPDGWDCADAVEESTRLISYIADHIPVVEVEPVDGDAQPEDDNKLPQQHRSEIVPLGYDDGRFYYYSKYTNQIKMLRDKEHGKTALLGLASIEWWLSKFDNGKGKVDWDVAVSFMMDSCRMVGIFDKQKIRGRGCWIDDSRFVLHLGDRLIVDGVTVDLGSFNSNYVYQAAARKKAPANPLNESESKGLIEAAKAFDWEMPASAALLAGFCVLAPICSSLEWRPHIWLTGGSGSGKSTVFNSFIKPTIGDMGIYNSLESTSAGLTQRLKADGFPVIFEEFDPSARKRSDVEKAQGFFNLMRLASDDSDVEILRGSATGESVTYNINSMFCLMGIQICTTEQAILNRTAQLGLRSRPKTGDKEQIAENKKQWDKVKDVLNKTVYSIDNLSVRLLARTLSMVDIIHHNIGVFRSAANKHFGNARYADQYGTLLAGAYSLTSDCKIPEDVALKYIEHYDWTVYTEDSEDDESLMAMNSILQVRLRVESEQAPRTYTVIEAIEAVRDKGTLWKDVDRELRRFGIICEHDSFIVSNRSDQIERELMGRPWGTNWGKYLKRIIGKNGEKTNASGPQSFGGISNRGTMIPYSIIDLELKQQDEIDF